MNKPEFIAAVSDKAGLSRKDTERVINAALDTITVALTKGEKVAFSGFGVQAAQGPHGPGSPHQGAHADPRDPRSHLQAQQGSEGYHCQVTPMRLDKYLKVSRLIKRRTVANEACDNGRISVNGRVVKASYDVKVGDRLEIALGNRTLAVEVLQVAETVKKDDACAMYKEV